MVVIVDQMVRMAKFCNFDVKFVISRPKNIENDMRHDNYFKIIMISRIDGRYRGPDGQDGQIL